MTVLRTSGFFGTLKDLNFSTNLSETKTIITSSNGVLLEGRLLLMFQTCSTFFVDKFS